jgi:hypothetical protein
MVVQMPVGTPADSKRMTSKCSHRRPSSISRKFTHLRVGHAHPSTQQLYADEGVISRTDDLVMAICWGFGVLPAPPLNGPEAWRDGPIWAMIGWQCGAGGGGRYQLERPSDAGPVREWVLSQRTWTPACRLKLGPCRAAHERESERHGHPSASVRNWNSMPVILTASCSYLGEPHPSPHCLSRQHAPIRRRRRRQRLLLFRRPTTRPTPTPTCSSCAHLPQQRLVYTLCAPRRLSGLAQLRWSRAPRVREP